MKSLVKIIIALLIVFSITFSLGKVNTQGISSCTQGTTLNIVAHEDDSILFLSPDLLHDIQNGHCVVTVFVTAGDAGRNSTYWYGREDGTKAAYAQMAAVANSWVLSDAGVPNHSIPLFTLANSSNISLLFLRLPDGIRDGSGFSENNNESLLKLWQGTISVIHTIDGSSSYSKQNLTETLASIVNIYQPDQIRTQNYVDAVNDNDHSDHSVTAYFAHTVSQQYTKPHGFTGYYDYQISTMPINVFGNDVTLKQNAFLTYAQYDPDVCQTLIYCQQSDYGSWLLRQYIAGSEGQSTPTPTPTPILTNNNIAPAAVVSASSENISTNQQAIKAIDGYIDGYPNDHTREWATQSQGKGTYLKLVWPTPHTINKIILYDRPNLNDQITSGTLTFSDGTSIPVGTLNNDDSAVTFTFSTKTINSVRLDITGVSSSTENVGLAEIQVYESQGLLTPTPTNTLSPTLTPTPLTPTPNSTPTPTPTSVPTPKPTATPTPLPTPTPTTNGLMGQYFNSVSLSGTPVLTKIDPIVNFDWGTGSPASLINTDLFSIRWTGYIKPLYSQTYTFCVGSDDGSRLWVNNKQIINYWKNQLYSEHCGNISLKSNTKYSIKLEYYDRYSNAAVKLYWKSSSQVKQIIPSSQLFTQ